MSHLQESVSTSLCGRKLSYPSEIDEKLVQWVKEQLTNGIAISPDVLRKEALRLIQPYYYEFKASTGWLDKFLTRHKISLNSSNSSSKSSKHVTSPTMEKKNTDGTNALKLRIESSLEPKVMNALSPREVYTSMEQQLNDLHMATTETESSLSHTSSANPLSSLVPSNQQDQQQHDLSQIKPHSPQQQLQQQQLPQQQLPLQQLPQQLLEQDTSLLPLPPPPVLQPQNHVENGEDDEEDDDDDDNENKKENIAVPQKVVNPERLKAFNMFVRLFIDENLDRLVPISKQPKEKINAIIMSCQRQFPEFSDRARKRIRTYLKSCRRSTKLREPTSRPSLSHIPATQLKEVRNILAQACHNESEEVARRQRIETAPTINEVHANETSSSKPNSLKNMNSVTTALPTSNQAELPPVFQSFMASTLKQPSLKLNHSEVGSIKNLIEGYRQSALFLNRSADELERLLKTCAAYSDDQKDDKNREQDNSSLIKIKNDSEDNEPLNNSNVNVSIHATSKSNIITTVKLSPTNVIKDTSSITDQSVEISHFKPISSQLPVSNDSGSTLNGKKIDSHSIDNSHIIQSENKDQNGLLIPANSSNNLNKQKEKIHHAEKSLEPLIKKIKEEKKLQSCFSKENSKEEDLVFRSASAIICNDQREKGFTTLTRENIIGHERNDHEMMDLSKSKALSEKSDLSSQHLPSNELKTDKTQRVDQYQQFHHEKYQDSFHNHLSFQEKTKQQQQQQQQQQRQIQREIQQQREIQDQQANYSPKGQKQTVHHFDQELTYKVSKSLATSPALEHIHSQGYYSEHSSPSLMAAESPLSQMQSYQSSKHLPKLQGAYQNMDSHMSSSPQHSTNVPTTPHEDGEQLGQRSEQVDDHSSHVVSYSHEYSPYTRQIAHENARISPHPHLSQQHQINRSSHSGNYHPSTPSGHHQNIFNFDQQVLDSSHQQYIHQRLSPHLNNYHPLLSPQDIARQSSHMQDLSRQTQFQNISRQTHIQELNRQQMLDDMNRQNHLQELNRHSDYQFSTHGMPFDMHSSH